MPPDDLRKEGETYIDTIRRQHEICWHNRLEELRKLPSKTKVVGRPRKIPETAERTIMELYKCGYSYVEIAELLKNYGIRVHYTTVGRLIASKKGLGVTENSK